MAPTPGYSSNLRLRICAIAAFTIGGCASLLLEAPLVQLLEKVVCGDHYYAQPSAPAAHAINGLDQEARCKVEPVKSKVATLLGVKVALDSIPGSGLLTAVYFGGRADNHGRKPIMLAYTGEALALLWVVSISFFHTTFPIWAIWLSSLFLVLGGGISVFLSMIYAMLADSFEPSKRTKLLHILAAIEALISVFAPLVGGLLTKRSIWLPFGLAMLLDWLCYPFMLALPETWKPGHVSSLAETPTGISPLLGTVPNQAVNAEPEHALKPTFGSIQRVLPGWITNFACAKFEWVSNPDLGLSFLLFFLKAIALSSSTFILQHASSVLGWELHSAVSLLVLQSVGSIFTTALVIPVLTSYLLKSRKIPLQHLDLRIIRVSLVIPTLGYLCLAEARTTPFMVTAFPGILIMAAGSGIAPALRTLMISFADEGHNARAYTTVTVLEMTGTIIGGPFMALLFSISLRSEGWRSGLCFLSSSALFGIMAIITLRFKMRLQPVRDL